MIAPVLTALAMVSLAALPAPALEQVPVHALHYDLKVDAAVTAGLLVAWVGSETLFKSAIAPAQCRWCDRGPDGSDRLSPVDRWGRGLRGASAQLKSWDLLSNLADFGALPVAMVGLDLFLAYSGQALEGSPIDLLLIAEASAVAMVMNQTVKGIAGRERPFVHALPEDQKGLTDQPLDNNVSFFSGHSSFAFALVVSAGTIAELRGYRYAWLIWAVGLPLAATVPLLRMAADRHYLSDVVVGSAVGAAVGFAVPRLFHGRAGPLGQVRVSASPGGLVVSGVL